MHKHQLGSFKCPESRMQQAIYYASNATSN